MTYTYTLATLGDCKPRDTVFVPNCTAREAIELWRYFSGLRSDFPEYVDHSVHVTGVDDDAWCSPKVYREAYAPPEMVCIRRSKKRSRKVK